MTFMPDAPTANEKRKVVVNDTGVAGPGQFSVQGTRKFLKAADGSTAYTLDATGAAPTADEAMAAAMNFMKTGTF